jgi:hypothetical protein
LQDGFEGVFGVSLSVGSAEMGEEHHGFGVVFEQFLEGGDGACMEWVVLLILLTSPTLPSLMGTLKSARTTTCEAGVRCLARSPRVAFLSIDVKYRNILLDVNVLSY